MSTRLAVILSLLTIIVALQVVGLVSHTAIRHLVQTAPLMAAIVLALVSPRWSIPAAAPLFTFWLLLMFLIWLFLLGIARIVKGTFTPIEVAMTIAVACAAIAGLAVAARNWPRSNIALGIAIALLFTAAQFYAFRLSQLPPISHR
jgi:hypothetical protein